MATSTPAKKRTTSSARNAKRSRLTKRRHMTPEDLLRFVWVADSQMSPDGESILFSRKHVGDKNEYTTNLWVVSTKSGEARQFTGGGKDHTPRYTRDGSRIAFISGRSKPLQQIWTIPAAGGEATALTSFPEGSIGTFAWSPDGSMLAVSFREKAGDRTEKAARKREETGESTPPYVIDHWWYRLDGDGYFGGQRYRLYLVDAQSGEHRCMYKKDALGFFTFDWAPDSKRLVVAANHSKGLPHKPSKDVLEIVDVRSGSSKRIAHLPDGPKYMPRWSPDGKWIAYAGRIGGEDGTYSTENLELMLCSPTVGKTRSLTDSTGWCLLSVALSDAAEVSFEPCFRWVPGSKKLLIKIGVHGESHIVSVPIAKGKPQILTKGRIDHDMGSLSADGKRIALTYSTPTKLHEITLGEISQTGIRKKRLTSFNDALLDELQLADIDSHWIKAADGHKTQVWIMRPPGKSTRSKSPAVLEIHGGPHAQYGVGLFHEFQVLAAAGYTVFYSNPRGSKGYGRDHCAAIRGDWGNADWMDVQAVTEFMKTQPFVDAQHMGVMGGSYGGFMTNWVIGHTNEFAGAITDRCVSNMVSMTGSSDFILEPDRYFPGNAWDRAEERWRTSPMKYIGNAKTPTLIIHSEGDLRCNIEQAEQVFVALSLLKVPTRLVRYPASTSHGMSRNGPPDLRLHRLHQILEWWRKYLT